jgi:hypothetical protein
MEVCFRYFTPRLETNELRCGTFVEVKKRQVVFLVSFAGDIPHPIEMRMHISHPTLYQCSACPLPVVASLESPPLASEQAWPCLTEGTGPASVRVNLITTEGTVR